MALLKEAVKFPLKIPLHSERRVHSLDVVALSLVATDQTQPWLKHSPSARAEHAFAHHSCSAEARQVLDVTTSNHA